jgi:lipoate-protein ligase A
MVDTWRILPLETADAYTNMAVDEAILKARTENRVPNTLRFYLWKPSAVSIGRFQTLDNEIFVENCKKDGVDIVRRISGGGAVYHDTNGEITYSVIVKTTDLGCQELDLRRAYQKICSGLNQAVTVLGTNAEYRPPAPKRCPNLAVSGKKISGNAQTTKKGILLQHGTFLLDIDHEKMFSYLKIPWAKTLDEIVKVSKRKLTSVRQELGSSFSVQKAHEALISGFKQALSIELVSGELTEYEQTLAEKNKKERYVTEEWNVLGKASV